MKLLTRNVNGYFILVAAVARVISAMTHSTWHHPDEWFQTVEFSNYIVNGVISHTQEVDLHMRNLRKALYTHEKSILAMDCEFSTHDF